MKKELVEGKEEKVLKISEREKEVDCIWEGGKRDKRLIT